MIEFYPQIRLIHMIVAISTGIFFALRGSCMLAGMRWPKFAAIRYLSYTIDTVLLTAALMLWSILPTELFSNGWLTVKVILVVCYVVLGVLTFRSKGLFKSRIFLFITTLLVYTQIYYIARTHHPLGIIYLLFS